MFRRPLSTASPFRNAADFGTPLALQDIERDGLEVEAGRSPRKIFKHAGCGITSEGEITMAKRTDDVVGGLNTATSNLDPSHELPPAQGIKAQAQDLAQGAKEQVKNLASEAKDQAKTLASDAKDQAKEVAGQARDHVQNLVAQQKDQAAERLGSLAEALREAGRKLNEGQQAGDFGHYADRAAQQVERLSGYLRDNDLRGFVRDTESFARRRPEVFLGGTLVAGLMLARFLKASSPSQSTRSGYDGGAWTGYPQSAGRTSYDPKPSNPTPGAGAGTTSYDAPMGA
jgi:hypothetical protein